MPSSGLPILCEAEETLERWRRRQFEIDLTDEAMNELDIDSCPKRVCEKLAEAGCEQPNRPSADDVLERLGARVGDTSSRTSASTSDLFLNQQFNTISGDTVRNTRQSNIQVRG